MADPWDDPGIWDPPAPPPSTPSEPAPTSGAGTTTGPTAPGLKANSWGSSYTTSPEWYENWAKSYFGGNNSNITQGLNSFQNMFSQYFGGGPKYQGQTDSLVGQLPSVWQQYQTLPGQIENKRNTLVDQIYANLPRMQELYQPAMEGMSRRGILNSDVTGKALGDIQSNVNKDIASQVAGANTWAADQGINYTQNMGNVLNSLINSGLGASSQYTSQGQAATGAAKQQQDLVAALIEALKSSASTQGSNTYNV